MNSKYDFTPFTGSDGHQMIAIPLSIRSSSNATIKTIPRSGKFSLTFRAECAAAGLPHMRGLQATLAQIVAEKPSEEEDDGTSWFTLWGLLGAAFRAGQKESSSELTHLRDEVAMLKTQEDANRALRAKLHDMMLRYLARDSKTETVLDGRLIDQLAAEDEDGEHLTLLHALRLSHSLGQEDKAHDEDPTNA